MTPIQKFCLARAAKLAAEIEEKKYHTEVLKLATQKAKPLIVRAEWTTTIHPRQTDRGTWAAKR